MGRTGYQDRQDGNNCALQLSRIFRSPSCKSCLRFWAPPKHRDGVRTRSRGRLHYTRNPGARTSTSAYIARTVSLVIYGNALRSHADHRLRPNLQKRTRKSALPPKSTSPDHERPAARSWTKHRDGARTRSRGRLRYTRAPGARTSTSAYISRTDSLVIYGNALRSHANLRHRSNLQKRTRKSALPPKCASPENERPTTNPLTSRTGNATSPPPASTSRWRRSPGYARRYPRSSGRSKPLSRKRE